MVFNESATSNTKFDAIADIHPGKENIRINVRVLRLWKVPTFLNPSENGSMEMVLVDDQGGKIHASVKKQLIYMFESKIEDGKIYDLSCFAVYPQSGSYRTTLHPYKIVFQMKTKVKLSEGSSIDSYGLSLTDISDVCAHTHDYEFLVDVIGYLTGLSAEREYIRDGKITKMVVAELTDHSGKCEIALFGDYAIDLTKKVDKSSGGLPIVVVQFAKVKIFRDKASLQNVKNTTRIFVNPNIAEVETFKNSVAVHGFEAESSAPLIGGPAKPSFEEEFLQLHPKMNVSQLDGLDEGVRFVDGSDWWYPACKCHRSVVADSGSYFCSSCDRHVFQVVPRFRVKVEVNDGSSFAVFVIFDSEMAYIMKKSCAYFVSQSKVCNGASHPNEFDGMVGKKMLFCVQKSPQLGLAISSYRVKRICMDAVLIDKFCTQDSCSKSSEAMGAVVGLDSDGVGDEADGVLDSKSLEFLDNVILTPVEAADKSIVEDEAEGSLKSIEVLDNAILTPLEVAHNLIGEDEAEGSTKRNLSKSCNSAPKRQPNKRLKPVKTEKD
ncbi:replication factor A protein [Trifolium repens]|nr:replication factor A protein [Trifolium repens]